MPKTLNQKNTLLADINYIAFNSLLWLLLFGLCRCLLILWNFNLIEDISGYDLAHSFFIGARFDLTVIIPFMTPVILALALPQGLKQRWIYQSWMLIAGAFMLLIAVAEFEFYHEFHSRMNTIALQYLSEDAGTVSSMVINGSPVVSLLSIWLLLVALLIFGTCFINKRTRQPVPQQSLLSNYAFRVPVFFLVFILAVIAGRGTLRSGPPLRWGDAFNSNNLFANHLGLNGVHTLSRAAMGWNKSKSADEWLKFTDISSAQNTARDMLEVDGDLWLDENIGTVYRRSLPTPLTGKGLEGVTNVAIIMMESFSGYYVGALGSNANITPYFDELSKEGLLLTRFFSNGTHTHQGMFATFACFPNLPDHEYLMQQPAGDITFSGFPAVMNSLGYTQDAYVYNGDFAWDNQKGFFSKQGLRHFVGRNDYINPIYSDSTWGVSDQDMFNRAETELDLLDNSGRFFAMLQTLSNHLPYALPSPLPVEEVTEHGDLNEHLTAMRYSDWALGQFFEHAKTKPWYKKTLFIVVGDHGFGVPKQITDIDLLRFRVPALFIAPGIQEEFGETNDIASSQVDLVPTAAALLGQSFEHACWGRNLLGLPNSDPGFAIIKPSGSDKTVALISGETILVKAPDQAPKFQKYDLNNAPYSQPIENPNVSETLYQQLGSYIQSALNAIGERKAGQH